MKIAVLTSTFPPYRGGMGNIAFYEARALSQLGHDVTVLTPAYCNAGSATENGALPRMKVERLKTFLQFGNAAVCRGVVNQLRKADLIYLHYPFFGVAESIWFNRLIGRLPRRIKFVIRYDMDVIGCGLKKLIFRMHTLLLMPAILRSADRVIFSSSDYAEHSAARSFFSESRVKCVVLPYGIDRSRFYRDKSDVKSAKALLFVGGLDRSHYFKGVENLLRAMAPLILCDREITLSIVGRGDMLEYYRNLAVALGIDGNVFFLTGCDDNELRRQFARSIVTILPSQDRSESFGLVLLESMACGTAVIASELPGVRTLVTDGVSGHLVRLTEPVASIGSTGNVESIRTTIEKAIRDPDAAVKMGMAGMRKVDSQFDWNVIAQRIVESVTEDGNLQ